MEKGVKYHLRNVEGWTKDVRSSASTWSQTKSNQLSSAADSATKIMIAEGGGNAQIMPNLC